MLTCESVGLINCCNATWQVSNSLLYVRTYVRMYVSAHIHAYTYVFVTSAAYEPPKAAKEHETYTACQVPSQSKSIAKNFPYKESKILLFEAVCGL